MTTPAKIRVGDVLCTDDCMISQTGGPIKAEKVVDDDDTQEWEVECPTCGATGRIVDEKGFNPNREVPEPFELR